MEETYYELRYYYLIKDVTKIIADTLDIDYRDIFEDIIDELYDTTMQQNKGFTEIDLLPDEGVKDYFYCCLFETMIDVCASDKYLKEKICLSILVHYQNWKSKYYK